jgi:hypothetical protein
VAFRQAELQGDPCLSRSRHGSASPSPRAIPTCSMHHVHACNHHHTHGQAHANGHGHTHHSEHAHARAASSSSQQCHSQPQWKHGGWHGADQGDRQGGWGVREGVEGRSRPQSARPGGFNREGARATAEAVHLASQVSSRSVAPLRGLSSSQRFK